MRAVNLMPLDARAERAASGNTSYGPYILLGGLAGVAVMAAMWTISGKQVSDRTATLQQVNAEVAAAEARATKAAPYVKFAQLARDRVATVTSLSSTRFDFAHGLSELSRVLPDDVWLTTVTASSGAAGGAPSPTSSAAPAPRFEIDGCTKTQSDVARLMARLRAIDGVRTVELRSSAKPDAGAAASATGGICPASASSNPTFKMVISFGVPGAPKPQVDSTGQIAEAAPPPAPAAPADPSATGETASLNSPAPAAPATTDPKASVTG